MSKWRVPKARQDARRGMLVNAVREVERPTHLWLDSVEVDNNSTREIGDPPIDGATPCSKQAVVSYIDRRTPSVVNFAPLTPINIIIVNVRWWCSEDKLLCLDVPVVGTNEVGECSHL